MFDLSGKVALVAGGTGYLGFPVAQALAKQGAAVVVASRDAGRIASAVTALRAAAAHDRVLGLQLDMGDERTIQETVTTARERFGRLDILVNATFGGGRKRFDELDATTMDQANHVHITGGFLLARSAAVAMDHGGEHNNLFIHVRARCSRPHHILPATAAESRRIRHGQGGTMPDDPVSRGALRPQGNSRQRRGTGGRLPIRARISPPMKPISGARRRRPCWAESVDAMKPPAPWFFSHRTSRPTLPEQYSVSTADGRRGERVPVPSPPEIHPHPFCMNYNSTTTPHER